MTRPGWGSCGSTPVEEFDALLLDLDGVVYTGPDAVPGARDALRAAKDRGVARMFVTNNASRTPEVVAEHLDRLVGGVGVEDVVTSAQAAAAWLSRSFPAGSGVYVVGGEGLRVAVTVEGLTIVDDPARSGVVAVVQGFGPDVGWRHLATATHVVREGATWVATNLDATVPTPQGRAPGNGLLVDTVARAVGRRPDVVVGKPAPELFRAAATRLGATTPLVVGDRLDTDLAGARAAGYPGLLVLTGVSDAEDLLAAAPEMRPALLGRDLSALHHAHPQVVGECGRFRCRDAEARLGDGNDVTLSGRGGPDGLDLMRAAARLAWEAADEGRALAPDTLAAAARRAG